MIEDKKEEGMEIQEIPASVVYGKPLGYKFTSKSQDASIIIFNQGVKIGNEWEYIPMVMLRWNNDKDPRNIVEIPLLWLILADMGLPSACREIIGLTIYDFGNMRDSRNFDRNGEILGNSYMAMQIDYSLEYIHQCMDGCDYGYDTYYSRSFLSALYSYLYHTRMMHEIMFNQMFSSLDEIASSYVLFENTGDFLVAAFKRCVKDWIKETVDKSSEEASTDE